ncbi:MAG: TOBE domain-containing protein [Mesosutterella multiformis]|nr:TOBE domain-containing protein [Mesosutterella multiformis]
MVSSISTASAESLGLDVGVKAFAVIKTSNVMVAVWSKFYSAAFSREATE